MNLREEVNVLEDELGKPSVLSPSNREEAIYKPPASSDRGEVIVTDSG